MDDQKPKCPNHPDKESAFYCLRHTTSACLKCVGIHIQCQVENQFLPLEELFETLQAQVIAEKDSIGQKVQDCATNMEESSNKLTALENLKNQDIQSIEDFFEEMKKKAEDMKKKVIENYETGYTSIVEKVSANNKNTSIRYTREKENFTKIEKLQESIGHSKTLEEKKASAVELWQDFERIRLEALDFAKFHTLDHELDFLMSKEEIFSEVGNLTSNYNNITSKVVNFMQEHMKEYSKDFQHPTREGKPGASRLAARNREMETLDEKLSKIDYLKEDKQVFDENFLRAMLETEEVELHENKKLHQLRYCSNEVNIFDCTTGKFSTYELYTTNTYKTPFYIFNNGCSAMYKNHLIFLFGGEDPTSNDKSSNRVFCFNLDQASPSHKVVVYEINPMANNRQEFTLTTIGNSIYIISGYDTNKVKEYRVIPKCERLDIKSKKFCDMRDINYPRQAACSVNVNNTHVYVFGGQNPKYLNHFVDKIERYTLNLDDWSVLKYSVMNEFTYEPGINATACRVGDGEIAILGGQREFEVLNGYYLFDMKKLLFVKKEEKFLEEADNFYNQNDVESYSDGCVKVFSSNMANYVYSIKMQDPTTFTLGVEIVEDENAKDYK